MTRYVGKGFGTIRNNTALKQKLNIIKITIRFGTIRNNTALKLISETVAIPTGFGTIRNNTALKPRRIIFLSKFRNRAIRPSQTSVRLNPFIAAIIAYFQHLRNNLYLV